MVEHRVVVPATRVRSPLVAPLKNLPIREVFCLCRKSGALEWNRTTDLGLRSPLLYPTELPGQKVSKFG